MYKYTIAILAVMAVSAGFAETEEGSVEKSKNWSIRAAFGTSPGWDEFEVEDGSSGSLDEEIGSRLEVLVVKRFLKPRSSFGGMFGGGVFVSEHGGKDAVGDEITSTAYGGMLQGGMAARAGKYVVLELGPYLGLGVANNEITGFSDGSGPFGLFGIKAGVFALLGESVELGVELGYEGIATVQDVTDGIDTERIDFTGGGARFAGVIMYKF